VLAIILFAIFKVVLLALLFDGGLFNLLYLAIVVVRTLVFAVLWLYFILIFFYGIAGFLMQGGSSPVYEVLAYVCDPVLNRIRKVIPSVVAGLDLSFLWALIAIQALIILIGEIRF
jgi:uncharacterized protein YggT (Ycf19 family)